MSDGPRVLFGVGAQKAGTTWLNGYLRAHPDCHTQSFKEFHYFDTLTEGEDASIRKRQRRELVRLDDEIPQLEGITAKRKRIRRSKLAEYLDIAAAARPGGDHGPYLEFLGRGRKDRNIVVDVTPAYATVGRSLLGEMASLTNDCRFVYVIRDPVDRVWSQIRMHSGKQVAKGLFPDEAQATRSIIDGFLADEDPGMMLRSDYRKAIGDLRATVAPDKLKIFFYESFFTEDSIRELCAFAGISYAPPETDRVVFGGPKISLSDEDRIRLRNKLADQYEYCAELFGDTLPEVWQRRMELA